MSKLVVNMISDWHVGSGTGRPGNVDRLVQRDSHELPYIPAKTLTGILRDSCELVANGLDEGATGGWNSYLEYLFGSQPALAKEIVETAPIPAALSLRSAHLPESLQKALAGKPELLSALTFVKPGVAINDQLGTAIPDCLRFEEMVRGGSYLEAKYHLNTEGLEDLQKRCLQALLGAGAAMVERIGAKRRRGAGRCKMQFEGIKLENFLEILEHQGSPPPIKVQEPGNAQVGSAKGDAVRGTFPEKNRWFAIELHLETISPLIVHSETLGNVVSTLDYIPGTYLLPIIGKQLQGKLDFSQAIADRHVIVGNGTLEVDGQQGRSMPFALFQEKQNKKVIVNRLGKSLNKTEDETKAGNSKDNSQQQLKGMRAGYVGKETYATVPTGVITHNTVNDQDQRPNEDEGGVYSYQMILSHTKLRAKIYLNEQAISKKTAGCLSNFQSIQPRLGQSKKDNYGLVKVTKVDFLKDRLTKIPESNNLTVWLLSDVLIRNDHLRPSSDPEDFRKKLSEELGLSLEFEEGSLNTFARSRRTDSWQTRWGLPRPSLVGLQAGSCFLFKVDGEIDPEILAKLEKIGIGERTVEGYGQLSFNDPLLNISQDSGPTLDEAKNEPNKPVPSKNDLTKNKAGENIYNYARIIEKEAWREAIRRESLKLAASADDRQSLLGIEESKPGMSQLGVLRLIVMTSLNSEPAKEVQWIEKLPKKIKEKWPIESLDKIKALLTNSSIVWNYLSAIGFTNLTLTRDGVTVLKGELWQEAVQVLVITMIRAHKRDLENNDKTKEKI